MEDFDYPATDADGFMGALGASLYCLWTGKIGNKMLSKSLLLIPTFILIAQNAAAVSIGTVAVYSDGSAKKLLAKKEGQLVWEDDRKRRFTISKNPIMPVLERREFLGGRGYQQRLGSGDPDAILSQPLGSRVEFSFIRTKHTGESSKRNYQCVRFESARQDVLGQPRRLDRYRCERFVVHRKYWTKQVRETREFSYSPELGLIVDLRRQTSKKSSEKKLVALIPPEKANLKQLSGVLRQVRSGR
jgi:hypothetical protein